MSALIVDGFDLYDSFDDQEDNRIQESAWTFTEAGGTGHASFVPGLQGGRMIKHETSLSTIYTLEQSFAGQANLACGALIRYDPISVTIAQNDMVSLREAGGSRYVSVEVTTGKELEMRCHPSGNTVTRSGTLIDAQYYYVEIDISGGNASFWVNGSQVGSPVSIGGSANFDTFWIRTTTGSPGIALYYDDVYVTDSSAPMAGRLGPIALVPMIPTAEGVSGTAFQPFPAAPATKHDKVDDHAANQPSDLDATYVVGVGDTATQLFTCTAENDFSGNALGYVMGANVKIAAATNFVFNLLASDGSNEILSVDKDAPIGQYQSRLAAVQTALPGGAPLTRANLEATQFGVRLKKI